MAIFHMYCDESGKKGDHPVVTFSGVCLPHSKLAGFDTAWNQLLRQYGITSLHMAKVSRLSKGFGPKMPRHQTHDERMDALIPFGDCINSHFEIGLLQACEVAGFNLLTAKQKKGLGSPNDPYYIAFSRGMLEAVDYIHANDRLSLVCDDDAETAWLCYQHYRGVRRAYSKVRTKTISLSFADDEYFPALQAADMVAFLSRLEAKRRFFSDDYIWVRLFNHIVKRRGAGGTTWMSMFANKEKMISLGMALEK
jgi:hypothetical protein